MQAALPEKGGSFRTTVSVTAGAPRTKHVPTFLLDPVKMGLHGGVAAHYRVEDGSYEETATTLDYFVGAVAAGLTGTFGGMLSSLEERPGHGTSLPVPRG